MVVRFRNCKKLFTVQQLEAADALSSTGDVAFEELPTEAEVKDPETGRPQKGIRYRVAKRSNPTPGVREGILHEVDAVADSLLVFAKLP